MQWNTMRDGGFGVTPHLVNDVRSEKNGSAVFGPEPTQEEIEQAKANFERAQAYAEMIRDRLKRMIAEELTMDQLEAVHAMLMHITNSGDALAVANWWEGVVHGTMTMRDILLGESDAANKELDEL
jgi:membrane carboxypeptidase/penicillin-binding protein